jgi:hypothetical protein
MWLQSINFSPEILLPQVAHAARYTPRPAPDQLQQQLHSHAEEAQAAEYFTAR